MSAESPRPHDDGSGRDEGSRGEQLLASGASRTGGVVVPELLGVQKPLRAASEQTLLRRAFGPQAGELGPNEVQALADIMQRRAVAAVARRSARKGSPGHADGAADDCSRIVAAPDDADADPGSLVEPAGSPPAPRSLLRHRLREAAVGAAIAAAAVGIGVLVWTMGQPRPAAVLYAQPLAPGEIERTLEAEPNPFESFAVEDPVSYGEAYGVRVMGAGLSDLAYEGEMECIWLLKPDEFTIPLCSVGVPERSGYPRLIDIWYDGEKFTWNPTPTDDLRQIRISVQGDRLEMWEQTVDTFP